jgi:benzoate-CoA ligase
MMQPLSKVESTVAAHPAVLEAAVVGTTDAEGLTKTKAFVLLKPSQSVSEVKLKAFVKDRLAPYKYPRSIQFVNELPKTAAEKYSALNCVSLNSAFKPKFFNCHRFLYY